METFRMFDQILRYHGPIKLTHKINYYKQGYQLLSAAVFELKAGLALKHKNKFLIPLSLMMPY